MNKLLLLGACVSLSGCASLQSLTPTQDAQLACLATTAASQLASTHANPVSSAQIQADGSTLCTLANGAAVVIAPSK